MIGNAPIVRYPRRERRRFCEVAPGDVRPPSVANPSRTIHLDGTLGSMAVASTEAAPRALGRIPTAITVGVILLVVAVLVLGYVRVGWDRMEQACTADPPGNPQVSSVAFGWSWSAPGFTCTYGDGQSRSSLWF